MIYYLLATFFSALSNILGKYWAERGIFPGITGKNMGDIMLHLNLINCVIFFILFFFLKSRNKISFSIKQTFSSKSELKQALMLAISILASYYKLYLAGFITFSSIAIADMSKPFIVGILAIVFLREKLNFKSIKFIAIATLGLTISNFDKFHIGDFVELAWLMSWVLLASTGDITRRFYCRQRKEDMQALCIECVMFAFYSIILFSMSGGFSFEVLFSPYSLFLSLLVFGHHICLIHGVRKATSIISLEFVTLAKPIFTFSLSAIFLGDYPSIYKIVGAIVLAVALLGFNKLEQEDVKVQKVKS